MFPNIMAKPIQKMKLDNIVNTPDIPENNNTTNIKKIKLIPPDYKNPS